MNVKSKAYSYLRISSDLQKEGTGIKRQMEVTEKWADENGYELVETLQDIGVSAYTGKNSKVGALSKFIDAINSGAVAAGSVLIVESLDRLSRQDPMAAFTQFSQIISKGVTIVTLVDGQVYSPDSVKEDVSKLFISLGSMMRAHDESKVKSTRQSAAWQHKREAISAKKMTKMVPAWLELAEDRETFKVKESAAETIQQIFEWSIDGLGIYSITRKLNGDLERYPVISSAPKWYDSYVTKILNNRSVFGEFQPHQRVEGKRVPIGEPVKDYFPAIVTEDTFLLAKSKMRSRLVNGAGRKGKGFSNIFTNLLTCGKCGGTVVMKNKGRPPKGFKYLRCHNSIVNSSCDCPSWRYSEFEGTFLKFVRDVSFEEALKNDNEKTEIAKLRERRDVMSAKMAESNIAYDNIVDQFAASLPETLRVRLIGKSEELEKEISELGSEISSIDAMITEAESYDALKERSDFIEAYDMIIEADDSDLIRDTRFRMNGILRSQISHIEVHNGTYFEAWEEIPESLRAELADKGIISQNDIETYLSKPHGKRLRDKHDRHFLVHFKNGVRRRVGAEYTLLDVSKSDLAAIEKFESK